MGTHKKQPSGTQLAVSSYYDTFEFDGSVDGSNVRVVSKAGLPHMRDISDATLLLAETATVPPEARILVIGSGQGALAVALARRAPNGWIDVLDVHIGALAMAERTLRANDIAHASVRRALSVLPESVDTYDLVVLEAPTNRGLARRWLVEAYAALREEGTLYLAGANNQGIQSIIADAAACFGNIAHLGYKAKHRVARARKTGRAGLPDWAIEPGIVPESFQEVDIRVDGLHNPLFTLPGVFAHDRLDPGTALLLDHVDIKSGETVLDAGCGIGVLGMFASQRGAGQVDLVDVNLLAVAATAKNVSDHDRYPNTRVLLSDGFQAVADTRYDLIISNPPFHAGKSITYDVAHTFMVHGRKLLRRGGRIVLVANRFLAYDQVLKQHYKRVERLAQTSGFHVLVGET